MDNLELIKDDGNTVAMPSLSSDENKNLESLKSTDILPEITGETVATVIIKKDMNMELPNYVLDFSEYDEITIFQKDALATLISTKEIEKEQKSALYLYNGKDIMRIGYGERYMLEVIIPLLRDHIFNKEIKIYRDVDGKKPLEELKSRDKTKIRLGL